MTHSMMYLSIIVIVAAIFTLASTSIGVQCYNDNNEYKKSNYSKFGFTVFCLVLSIFALIGGGAGMVLAYRAIHKTKSA